MSLGLPAHLEPLAVSRAFARSSHVAALACLVATIVCLLSFELASTTVTLWPAMLALLPLVLLLVLNDRFDSRASATLYLALGAVAMYCYAVAAISLPTQPATDNLLLTLPKIALVMIGRPRVGHWSPVGWCLGGFLLAEGATVLAASRTGAEVVVDVSSALTTLVLVAILSFIAARGLALQPAKPNLLQAARDEHLAAMRARVESQAAAVLHDTVLSQLAALASAPVGTLPPHLRDQVVRDLEVIVGEEWLSEVGVDQGRYPGRFETGRFARVIDEAVRLGIEVDVSGDILALERLTPGRATAVALATRQCLSNVARHAGTDRAEVVVFGSGEEVSIMVVDAGRGFDVSQPRRDRLGLSHSIRQRIENVGGSVQVWSTRGRGTSVRIRVPADRATVVSGATA